MRDRLSLDIEQFAEECAASRRFYTRAVRTDGGMHLIDPRKIRNHLTAPSPTHVPYRSVEDT